MSAQQWKGLWIQHPQARRPGPNETPCTECNTVDMDPYPSTRRNCPTRCDCTCH